MQGALTEPRDLAVTAAGQLLVTDYNRLLRLSSLRDKQPVELYTAPQLQSCEGVAVMPNGDALLGITRTGVLRLSRGVVVDQLESVDGRKVAWPSAIACLDNGDVVVTDAGLPRRASGRWDTDEWVWNLVERRHQGRVIVWHLDGTSETVADGLAFPYGVADAKDTEHVLVSEAWTSRILRLHLRGRSEPSIILPSLPGYPARIKLSALGESYWVSVFAPRTQMFDFILQSPSFRKQMMSEVQPRYWLRPLLRPIQGEAQQQLLPLQQGGLITLGRKKKSAPPRSYGLVLRMSKDGTVLQSFHDPEGGPYPGVLSAVEYGSNLVVASGGGRVLVEVPYKPAASE